jgi:oligoribonuclease NrnB/cAMP/cGMP phosphodiesterase (DHH superfamily)
MAKVLKVWVSVFRTKAGYNSFLIRSHITKKSGRLWAEKRKYSFHKTCRYVTISFRLLDADCIITGLYPDAHMKRQFYQRFPKTSCSGDFWLKKKYKTPPHKKIPTPATYELYVKCKIETSPDLRVCDLKPSQMVILFNQIRLFSFLFTTVNIKQVITTIKICYLHYQDLIFMSTYILFTLNT